MSSASSGGVTARPVREPPSKAREHRYSKTRAGSSARGGLRDGVQHGHLPRAWLKGRAQADQPGDQAPAAEGQGMLGIVHHPAQPGRARRATCVPGLRWR